MNFRGVVKKIIPTSLFKQIEPAGHLVEAIIAQTVAGFPAKNLKVIGVTGTDGKTSTSTLIAQMLRSSGLKTAMLTTISMDFGDGKGERPNPTRLTTTGAMSLARNLQKVKQSGAEWLVLETTSHALAQHRSWGVPYSIAVMTNINHEHLDYHGTFENYKNAKKKLFERTDANKKGLRMGIVNADDPSGEEFASVMTNSVSYGVKKGDLRATEVKLTSSGSKYKATMGEHKYDINCHLPGSFNVSNSLAAVAVGWAVGLTSEQIEKGIASLTSVEGRMTRVDEGQDFEVVVDYAHTPDSFKKIFEELKPLTKGRLIGVFGSAGRRDTLKRPIQGEIAGKFCDIVIVTEEDDYDCDGQEILHEIAAGIVKTGKKEGHDLFLIHQREMAIAKAIDLAKPGDTVVLLGKGHEKSILTNGPSGVGSQVKRGYDEVSVARSAIKRKSS